MKSKKFNSHEVQAIIAGNKTMFREVIKPPKHESLIDCVFKCQLLAKDSKKVKGFQVYFQEPKNKWFAEDKPTGIIVKSKFEVGQEIFVKESWRAFTGETLETPLGKMKIYSYPPKEGDIITYKADAKSYATYLSSTTMPQWASRITLKIKSVKVERLADINEADCLKEGIGYTGGWNGEDYDDGEYYFGKLTESKDGMYYTNEMFEYAEHAFEAYWNSMQKKQEHEWKANPWVFVYEFEVINIKK